MITIVCTLLIDTSYYMPYHEVEHEYQCIYVKYPLVIMNNFRFMRKVYILNGQPSNMTPNYCYERYFMLSLETNSQADVITAFDNTSRYLDNILNLGNPFFEKLISSLHSKELRLNKPNNLIQSLDWINLTIWYTGSFSWLRSVHGQRNRIITEKLLK